MSSSSSAPSLATNATGPAAKPVLRLPPGFHFVPTDAELVVHYLRPRLANRRLPLPIFVEERILDYHPDALIEKYRNYGEERWFFFTARERKHLGGNRPNRTTPDNGHWNATGSVKPIRSRGVLVGCRRTLVFYEASRSRKKKSQQAGLPAAAEAAEAEEEGNDGGQAAKATDGVKTDWTMCEYLSLASEAEYQAILSGNANKMDELVLCTIQKKKHSLQEGGGEGKKSRSKRKTKEEKGLELEAVAAGGGDVEQGSRDAGTTEGQDEDHMQIRALMEAAETQEDQAIQYHAPAAAAGVDNFNIDPDLNMPYYYYLANSLSSSPVPAPPPQETLMAPPAGASGDKNHTVMRQQNYYSMNTKTSQSSSFHAQATPPPQEFLPYLDTKMAAPPPPAGGFVNMLQNRFIDMMHPQAPEVPGTGMYLSPRRPCSKSDVWEQQSAELHPDRRNWPLKSEDACWWSSSHCQAKQTGRELNISPYVSNSQQETVAELAARGRIHTAMLQRNYLNHSMAMTMRNSQFHVQAATQPQEEFLPYSSTKMAALGGGSIVDHHMLQNRIVDVMPAAAAAEANAFTGLFPSLSNSGYGRLSTRMEDHPAGPSSVSFFPSQQQSHGAGSRAGMQGPGPVLNNQVNLSHQNYSAAAAASMVGYDQRNDVGLPNKIA